MTLFPYTSAELFLLEKSVKDHMLGGAIKGVHFTLVPASFTSSLPTKKAHKKLSMTTNIKIHL